MGGNFLSQPKRDGPGECDTDRDVNMSYGVIGLQGWRLNMEVAIIKRAAINCQKRQFVSLKKSTVRNHIKFKIDLGGD